jgi:hypothetical protein
MRALALASVLLPSVAARADDAAAPATTPAIDPKDWRNQPIEHETNRAHFIGVRGNFGSAYEVGVGYIHAHESMVRHAFGGSFWFGYGPDVRFVIDGDGLAGVIGALVGRTAYVGHGLPMGLELALGVGSGSDETRMTASGGAFVSLYYADLGYQYQMALVPFARPEWLGAHFFAVRGHVPVARYRQRKWTEPPISQRK